MLCFPSAPGWSAAVRPVLVMLALVGGAGTPAAAEEGVLSQLYAARPPAGSSFVRVVNAEPAPLAVRVATGPLQQLGPQAPAGSYAIVRGGEEFTVHVGGAQAARLRVPPDSFHTLVLRRSAAGVALRPVDDTTGTEDALKAELRFYNLARGCPQAQLLLAPAGTPIFSAVAAESSAARSVNPVRASVTGQCGAAAAPTQALPTLQPGDHVSLFLLGDAGALRLVIQANRTDPVKR